MTILKAFIRPAGVIRKRICSETRAERCVFASAARKDNLSASVFRTYKYRDGAIAQAGIDLLGQWLFLHGRIIVNLICNPRFPSDREIRRSIQGVSWSIE